MIPSKWINRSFIKHFYDRRGTLTFYTDGQVRENDLPNSSLMELRINGPFYTEHTSGLWSIEVDVNILIQVPFTENLYDLDDAIDTVSAAFGAVSVLDLNDTRIDCMSLRHDRVWADTIKIRRYGRLDPSVPLLQATVEGTYQMLYKE